LLLVRHSVPAADPSVPSEEWRLSDEGRALCEALAGQVGAYEPQRLISSPEPKALETAELIAPVLGLAVEVEDGLRETARRTVGWLEQNALHEGIRQLFARPDEVVFGEESGSAALARFSRVVERVEEPAAFVTHGTVMSLYVAGSDPDGGFAFWKTLGLPDVVLP
jgi:2,3-bisphosphoglycerate-dependent phosphoglycerate mutase